MVTEEKILKIKGIEYTKKEAIETIRIGVVKFLKSNKEYQNILTKSKQKKGNISKKMLVNALIDRTTKKAYNNLITKHN